MAEMNLLQGSIRGSMGGQTGARVNGKNVVKKKIWSKTPGNETQTKCVRSFEALNRVSSAIAKRFWYYLGLRQGNMHKHNAVAKKFSAVVGGHVFNPAKFSVEIPEGNAFDVRKFKISPLEQKIELDIFADLPLLTQGVQQGLVSVFDGEGHVYVCEKLESTLYSVTVTENLMLSFPYYLLCFSSERTAKGWKLGNCTLRMTLPENVFYTENYPKIRWWTELPDKLCGEGVGVSTSGDVLVVDGYIG